MPYDPYPFKRPTQVPNSPLLQPVPQAQAMPSQQPLDPASMDPSQAEAAQMAALLGTYGDQMELTELEKQMAQAEALRMGTPEGRQAGRVYVAANPLEHLGKGIGDYKLMKKRQATEAASKPIRERIGTNVKKYGEIALKDI